jgi:hypothetical protein
LSDPFLSLPRTAPAVKTDGEKKHADLPPSGAERWFRCPGSVAISRGQPRKDSVWSKEGTLAHEVLELVLRASIDGGYAVVKDIQEYDRQQPVMLEHAFNAAREVLKVGGATQSEVLSEEKVEMFFIHPLNWGTLDATVVDHFGTLHIFDYKYGAGVAVSATENLQMIDYALGMAHRYHWNFKRVRLWIIQPRIAGYDGPTFWEIGIRELLDYVPKFQAAARRTETEPDNFVEGSWCHFCAGKAVCPKKTGRKLDKAREIFSNVPHGGEG